MEEEAATTIILFVARSARGALGRKYTDVNSLGVGIWFFYCMVPMRIASGFARVKRVWVGLKLGQAHH